MLLVPPNCGACLYKPRHRNGVPVGTVCAQDGTCWRYAASSGAHARWEQAQRPAHSATMAGMLAAGCVCAYTGPMSATETTGQAAAAGNGGGVVQRMWRKVVAFRRDQEAYVKEQARLHPTEPGNVSAVIRDAVDLHKERTTKGE